MFRLGDSFGVEKVASGEYFFLCLTAFLNNCVRYTIPCDNGVCWEERCDDNGDKCGDNSDEENRNTKGIIVLLAVV